MSVSAVSLNEINAVRGTMPIQIEKPIKKTSTETPRRYIDSFSDKKIANFFAPYGYVSHERSEDGSSVLVLCDDCQVIFDDFTVMAEPHVSLFTNNQDFNFMEFASLCEQANTTPSQAIADRLEEDVFNPMPYYVERKGDFVRGNLSSIKRNKKYGSLLSAVVQKQQHREEYAPLNKTYGSSNPEKIADTLARLIPAK